MAPRALRCKECGTDYPLEALLRLRALLRAARGRLRLLRARRRRRRSARSRPARRASGATRTSCRSASARRDTLQPGLTPLVRADRLAERLGARRGLDQERRRQPDPLVQGPGRRGRAGEGARARLRDGRLRLDRQPRERRRRACRGGRARLLRLRPRRPRGAEAARDRCLRDPAGRRQGQLRRRQPALHRALRGARRGRSSTSTCVPYLRGGLEDARLRDRRAARLGAARTGSSARSRPGSLFTKIGRGFQEWLDLGLVDGELPSLQRRPGGRAAARSPRRSPRAATSAGRSGPTRSRRASRSATPPTAPTRSTSPAPPAARSSRSTDDEIRDGIRLLAETTGIFTETAGGVTTAVLAKLAEAGAIADGERVVVVITGEGLKTLDAIRDGFEMPRSSRRSSRSSRGRRDRAGGRCGLAPGGVGTFPHRWRSRSRSRRSCGVATDGEEELEVDGSTVGEALDAVFDAHAELRERITEDGRCAGSSTSTSPARTSASRRASRRGSPTATR